MADNVSITSGDSIVSDDEIDDIESTDIINENITSDLLDEDLEDEGEYEDDDDDSDLVSNKISNNITEKLHSIEETYSDYYSNDKITKPYLSKFEKAKILGIRAEMLAGGAKPLIKLDNHISDVYSIAKLELESKKIPLLLRRQLPNGKFEDWRLEELHF